MDKRDALLELAADYVVEHGLIGLTLRPLAAALGTSDRMLLYHFDSRDDLVIAVIVRTVDRATAAVEVLPDAPSVRSGVNRLWEAFRSEPLRGCLHVYCQAAATGLIGQEPYRSAARDANARWAQSLRDYLVRCGASPRRVARVVRLVDSSLYGFHLDLITDRAEELARGVDDLARAAEALA
ncbi:TetR/AcrR family transcriptional regulator [Nocardioides antri]|uniref:TetR/AcrR family transcriptional regulator n=1 Tax=Nocardioides antri TaxID=2607659 RepID=A0A5B1M4U3_9ACTN|nr:TetR/AcrR family transcriptional regulator [Nocardioides antri]KAA1427781.1 TetR/AcrR family transcriptional regulator [Nocardioides antri]